MKIQTKDAGAIQHSNSSRLEISPGREEFRSLTGYGSAMLTAELSSDLETPVSAFVKLRTSRDEPCFMLESAESGRMWGRYSFLGFEPSAIARIDGDELEVIYDGEAVSLPGNPVESLFNLVEGKRVFISDSPGGFEEPPFEGGAVGYFGYGTLARIEKVDLDKEPGVPGVPETMFMFPARLVVFDHLRSRMRLCVMVETSEEADSRSRDAAYDSGVAALEEMARRVGKSLPQGHAIDVTEAGDNGSDDFEAVQSNVTRGRYEEMVRIAIERIFAGDAFQIVVSQRLSTGFGGDPFSIYRHLRAENPSPYMFYLKMPEVTLVGSSPEPMVTNRSGRAVIRPIAGTRPRGRDAAEDAALAGDLEVDSKERAEHIMLVDLARNDLGRASKPGTVKVSRMMEIERYSHVMHMVSEVEGDLAAESGNYELLKSSFPAGTVIGAPKVRASEIIEELEPDGRGPYAGAVGYISYSGDLDTCIAIRTVILRDGMAHIQAGAGIVADSEPASEYEETLNKARAVVRAVRAASKEAL